MSSACFVGFDTSNYTTSCAVCTEDGNVIANIKKPLPVKSGECGLRQSDAVFAHIKNLPSVLQAVREVIRPYTVRAVGCSTQPRRTEDSYMPCFLTGVAIAEAFAAATDVPVYRFAHQDGHIMSALYSAGAAETLLQAPFAAFHVSGGTTEMLYVTPQKEDFTVTTVGATADLNAGQAIDRVGVMMGLPFPCGKEMEALALQNSFSLPKPHVCVRNGRCNLSGLQNLAEKLWRETKSREAVSAYVFSFIGETLAQMTAHLNSLYPGIPIVYAGGVMSNSFLQQRLSGRADTYFSEPLFSADNAAGIALLCRRSVLSGAKAEPNNENSQTC